MSPIILRCNSGLPDTMTFTRMHNGGVALTHERIIRDPGEASLEPMPYAIEPVVVRELVSWLGARVFGGTMIGEWRDDTLEIELVGSDGDDHEICFYDNTLHAAAAPRNVLLDDNDVRELLFWLTEVLAKEPVT